MAPAVGHARLHHVPNPVDFSDSQRVAVENNDVFLFVGRLERDKGGLELAKAARAAGVRAVFVGAGREEKAICDILPEVEITGWLSPADVSAWLGRARCLVFPSLWYECQPLVPMEAIHKGVPVITGRWNAAQEIVTHNRTGLIYDRPEDLPTTLKMMGAEVAKSMSTKAYANRANVGSTPEQHAQDLLKVYADTMCHHAL